MHTMMNMRDAYVDLAKGLVDHGSPVEVRGQKTHEVVGVSLVFFYPERNMLPLGVGRNVNQKLAAVEALSLLAGTAERDLTLAAAPSYTRVLASQHPDDFAYAAYGPRLAETIDTVVRQLADDPTSRQAVLSIWRKDDLYHRGDKPCTLTIQFLLRGDQLNMVVSMRSNDVWLGLAYDAFVFSQLLLTVVGQLRPYLPYVRPGTYYHHAASLHVYARDFEAVEGLHHVDPVVASTSSSDPPPPLPSGVVCPPNWFPDQVAELLLRQPPDQPDDVALAERYNPWYARQMARVYENLERTVRS